MPERSHGCEVSRQLIDVGHEMLECLSACTSDEIRDFTIAMSDYHGFAKHSFSAKFLNQLKSLRHSDQASYQIELIRVGTDLSQQIHRHNWAYAYVICMGARQHLPPPVLARAYYADSWRTLMVEDRLLIPAGIAHGFTVDHGGILYFLSVQTPPIHRAGEDFDDYVVVSPAETALRR